MRAVCVRLLCLPLRLNLVREVEILLLFNYFIGCFVIYYPTTYAENSFLNIFISSPTGRRYRSRIEVRAHLAEPEGAGLEAYAHCLQDFSVHRKLARRLGWDHTSVKTDNPILATAGVSTATSKRTNSPANRIKKRFASPALKSEPGSPKLKIKKDLGSPLGSPKHKAELITSPVVKLNKEKERVSSPVTKVGRVASPVTKGSRVASPALKMNEQARVSSPAFKVKMDGAPIKVCIQLIIIG